MVAVLLICTCFGFAGCSGEDIVKVELKISVFNNEDNEWYDEEDTTLTIDLYRHLAPATVDAIVGYINEGYYDNAIFYGHEKDDTKMFVGDLKMDENGRIYQNEIKPQIEGEFEHGGTTGSNLDVTKGNVALWRTWYEQDGFSVSNNQHTGRATWFLPVNNIPTYQDWFCVYAVIDFSNETNANTWEYIKNAVMVSGNYETYELYYTGEYQATGKEDANYGLDFHCEKEVLAEHKDGVFNAEGAEYVLYNQQTIRVAEGKLGENCGAKIVSAKVVK